MIDHKQAERFASEWINAWNSHDIDKIMQHYAEDVEYFSPFIVDILGDKGAKIKGKTAVRDYLARGLGKYPDLHFKLEKVYCGVNSVAIRYVTVNDIPANEVFELNDEGVALRVQCHYSHGE